MNALKTRENKSRRSAERQGLILSKSARRDPQAKDFGLWLLWNGEGQQPAYTLTLDEVERELAKPKR